MNQFQARARDRKVEALINYIDTGLRDRGLCPIENASLVVTQLWSLNDATWDFYASKAGVRPPSDETKREVIARYRGRVDAAALMRRTG